MIDRGPIVIYDSQTGFTAKYALWIAEKLECPFISIKDAHVPTLQHYKTLIFGGRLIADKPKGFDFLRKHLKDFEAQNIAIYVTGSGKEQDVTKLKQAIFKGTEAAADGIPCYFLHSGLNYDKMSAGERLLMKVFCRVLKLSGKKEVGEKLSKSFDETNPAFVEGLVAEVKAMSE